MQKGIQTKGTEDSMPAGAGDECSGFLGRTFALTDTHSIPLSMPTR